MGWRRGIFFSACPVERQKHSHLLFICIDRIHRHRDFCRPSGANPPTERHRALVRERFYDGKNILSEKIYNA